MKIEDQLQSLITNLLDGSVLHLHIPRGGAVAAAAAGKPEGVVAMTGRGGAITREPGPVKGGTTVIAFITDPDGYKIELIERPEAASELKST